jgi:hypothetical protein
VTGTEFENGRSIVRGESRIRATNMTVLIEAPLTAASMGTIIAVSGTYPPTVTPFHKVECDETATKSIRLARWISSLWV